MDVVALKVLKITAGITAIHCSKYMLPEPSSLKTQPGCPGGARWMQMEQGTSCPLVSGAQGYAELHIVDQETQGRNLSPVFSLSLCCSGTASLPLPHLAHQALSWGCWWGGESPCSVSIHPIIYSLYDYIQLSEPNH